MATAGGTVLARAFQGNGQAVLKRWIVAATGAARGRLSVAEIQRDLTGLWDPIARSQDENRSPADRADATDTAKALLAELSRERARQGFTPSETALSVFTLKDAVLGELGECETVDAGFLEFSRFVDNLGLFTFESYVAAREMIIADQAEQLLELSTPVVKLWDGIVAVPLVGTLDSARTQVVMEKLLQALVDTGSEHAIIDITGVPAVDTQVAQHLLKTVVAARLMGAECIVSGIRPQIAQTMVALGIEFGDIVTKATLADALVAALRQSGTDIGRRLGRA